MSPARLGLALLLVAGCDAASKQATREPAAIAVNSEGRAPASSATTALQVAESSPADERRFGAAPSLPGEPLAVSEVLARPEPHLGKSIKCVGTVARVCQNAGCWLELQADPSDPAASTGGLRVPMANHAFFIPKDAVGKRAVVEGALHRQELPTGQREHYQSEGMQAVGPLSLDAVSVVLRGP